MCAEMMAFAAAHGHATASLASAEPSAAAFASAQLASATTTVHVFNFDFTTDASNSSVVAPTIHVGDTITWTWNGGFHSVTSVAASAEAFDSGDQSSGSFSHTFTHAGSFNYYCNIHGFDNGNGTAGGMAAFINVVPAPEPTTLAAVLLGAPLMRRRHR